MHAFVARVILRGRVPLGQHLPALSLCQEGEVGETLRRVGDDALQQGLKMASQAPDRGQIEQVGVIL